MSKLLVSAAVAAALVTLTAAAPASAVTYDKLAYLTFTAPVQVPGATLGAGTYRFHLTNPSTSRNVLQVLSQDGSVVYAMFHTIPDSRVWLTDDPIVTFRETPAGVPPAVRSIFYGNEYLGYEFVYPAGGPNMVAEVFPQPPITYALPPAVGIPEFAAPLVVPPVEEPLVETAMPAAEPELMAEAAVGQAAEPAPVAPAELPRTAGLLPLMTVTGLGSLLAGVGLGALRRRAR